MIKTPYEYRPTMDEQNRRASELLQPKKFRDLRSAALNLGMSESDARFYADKACEAEHQIGSGAKE